MFFTLTRPWAVSNTDLEPVAVSHCRDPLYFVLGQTEPAWSRGQEHRVFTHQVGPEGEDIVRL